MPKWIWRLAAALALGVYFFRLTRAALHLPLSPDAITNIYRVYSYPVGMLLRANFLFFETSPFYRPFASAWYLAIFHSAGIHPLAYQALNLVVLAANAFLTYAVAHRLTGWRDAGWLAALFACYHTQFNGLYFDAGFVFDVLCYFFYLSAFLYYIRIRQAGRYPGAGSLAVCAALFICALNSKEMAITLPAFLAIYECLYHPPGSWRLVELRRWMAHEWRGALVLGATTFLFLIGRATGEYSLMSNTAYRPSITWERFMLTSRQFLNDLFFLPNRFTTTTTLLLWAALAAIAWISKSKPLRFAWFFLMLSVAPVAFVEPRGAAQYYIPLFGWALYAATALAGLSRLLPDFLRDLRAPVVMAAALVLLYPFYKAKGHGNVTSVTVDGEQLQSLASQLVALHPNLAKGSHLLLVNESDDPAWDTWLAAVRLNYHDHDLHIDRARRMNRPIGEKELALYDQVLDYRDGRLVDFYRAPDPRLKPAVVVSAQGPELFHDNWSPVTAQNPGRRGETLIGKVSGLGATDPDVAGGQPFPGEPPASVVCRVAVRLNGRRTDTLNAFGWPGMVDIYRVDFRVPDSVKPGMATLDLAVRGVAAPAVQFPVRE
jgi:hypothetical protein